MTAIQIHGTSLPIVEIDGARMVTLAMIDEAHQRPTGTAGRVFRENRERFAAGRHYVQVSSDDIRRNSPGAIPDALRRHDVILLTERGYLLLAKSLTDDLAWRVQEELVDSYFHHAEALASLSRGDRQVHGGIIRSVTTAVMREQAAGIIAQVAEVVREQLPALIAAEVAGGSYQLVQGISAIEVAEIAGCHAKGRPRGLSQFVSKRLSIAHERLKLDVYQSQRGRRGVKLFNERASRAWLADGGGVEIGQYVAHRKGQGALRLPKGAA